MRRGCLAVGVALLAAGVVGADEYFVSRRGDDKADGRSEATAFATIAKAAAALKPGDTLTVLPGEYFESLRLRLAGRPDAPITFRAKHPGTAVMRGDVDAPPFRQVPGSRYTWVCDFDREVEGVGERDTAAMYAFVPSAVEVEDVRGACFYDREAKRLYVHTSDSAAPEAHALVVSVTNGFGILVEPPRGEKTAHDLVVDGLGFSGYMNREAAPLPGGRTRWGLYIVEAERCAVRRCAAFLNGGGIGLVRPVDCLIEDCVAFGNHSTFSSSGGNIICWSPARKTVMRNNVAHSTHSNGLRFYGGGTQDCVMEGNLAYDCKYGEIWIKGGENDTARMVRNISLGALYGTSLPGVGFHRNLYTFGSGVERADATNVEMGKLRKFDRDANFADPVGHDYRLQSDSVLRGKGVDGDDPGPFPYRDEVFFVSPTGDDAAKGTSVRQAWRTVGRAAKAAGPGHTVYLIPGAYAESLVPARSGEEGRPIVFRRRGHGRVLLTGDKAGAVVRLDGMSHVRIEGVEAARFTANDSRQCVARGCALSEGIEARRAVGLEARQCSTPRIVLRECGGTMLLGNSVGGRPALDLDAASVGSLVSGWNAFAEGGPIARIGDRDASDLDSWRATTGQDAASRVTAGKDALIGRGPLASNIGPAGRVAGQASLRIEAVQVLSVSATTANIEWWTPTAEATTVLEWGPTPECGQKVENIYNGEIFHTVSLTGLKPATRYYYRVSAVAPATEFHTHPDLAEVEKEKPRETARETPAGFETLAHDPPPRMLHVAVTGDDGRDGLTPATAWRTVRSAACRARPGDTVVVHGGTYEEYAPVRVTGDEGRPITFRCAPGETVWFEGSGQKRPTAFRLAFKHHVHLDGFYFRHFRSKSYATAASAGVVHVVAGSSNVARRCFYDGRTITYMPYFVLASDSRSLTLENCVVIEGWNCVSVERCPDLLVRHCVFYNGLIRNLMLFNDAGQKATLSHNLICDNIPEKRGNSLIELWHLESHRGDHNAFFLRPEAGERRVIGYVRVKGEKDAGALTLAEVQKATGQEGNSLLANPGIPVVKEMARSYKAAADHARIELRREGDKIAPLDFKDFFADPNGPSARAADGRPIGLDPAAFPDGKP